jgi:hypothetical protein
MRSEALTVVKIKTVVWYPYTPKIEAAGYAESLVPSNETTQCINPEDHNLNSLVLMFT